MSEFTAWGKHLVYGSKLSQFYIQLSKMQISKQWNSKSLF